MEQIWKPKGKKSDNLIIIDNETIYKGSPSEAVVKRLSVVSAEAKKEVLQSLYGIPYHYIHKIINQKGIDHIRLVLGEDLEEELYVEDATLKNEIFNYLKNNMSYIEFTQETPSVFSYLRPKIIGLAVASILFIWASYFAVQMQNGVEYEAARGITGLMIGLATFGIVKLLIGYIVIAGLTIFSMIRKLKTRSEIQTIVRS